MRSRVFAPLPLLALVVAAALTSTACGSSGSGGGSNGQTSCPNDVPASCSAPTPSYASDVAPIIQNRCVVCHGPGGVEAQRSFTSYDSVAAQRGNILSQVSECLMPPSIAQPLSAQERQTLFGWLVCGAPNN